VEECARQTGTTISVKSLFGNVPARAKFLRSAAVETRAVADAVVTLALAHLSSGFVLESNGRVLLELPLAQDLATRVADLWGEDVAGRFLEVGRSEDDLTLGGLIERPDAALSGPRRVYLFVNGRPFRDRDVVAAAERSYRTTVPHGARPSMLLYLHVGAGEVDVNVHPAKLEVRFTHRQRIHDFVEAAVHAALNRVESAATLDRRPALPQLRREAPVTTGRPVDAAAQFALFVAATEPMPPGAAAVATPAPTAADLPPTGEVAEDQATAESPEAGAPSSPGARVREAEPRPVLWQVHDTWILAETRTGLLIIDQHSAHERILFQQLMEAFDRGGMPAQRLLFPITLRLSPAEYSLVQDARELFERTGFEVEPFGGRTIIMHSAPAPHPWFDAERCVRDMIAELVAGSELTRSARTQYERIAMTFACKGAIKAGQRLTQMEMEELFERLFATDLPYHDVHGRPTVIRLSREELERRFGRHG
jgi:DNA mismatch repair protein MutL